MQGFISEDSKEIKTEQAKEQKEQEICAIQSSIVKYHLSRFCKANASALALIFKALIRGEAFYSKVQFLQDSSQNQLLYKKDLNKSSAQEVSQPNLQSQKPPNVPKEKSQKDVSDSALLSKGLESNQIKTEEKDLQKRDLQTTNLQEKDSTKETPKEKDSKSEKFQASYPFPLNIEG